MSCGRSARKGRRSLAPPRVPAVSPAADEPAYDVLLRLGEHVDIRRYAAYVVAEVLIAGPPDDAASRAFPILAGYIFGQNTQRRTFAMTTPVTQTHAPAEVTMLVPVTPSAAPFGSLVRFALPKGTTLRSAPDPTDARVQMREVAGHTLAAICYSGCWSRANDDEHFERLGAVLRAAQMPWADAPVYARYNAPGTPWALRRNEVWLSPS